MLYFTENNFGEGFTRGHILLSQISFNQADYNEAIKEFEIALQTMGKDDSREIASIYYNLGTSYSKLKDYSKADDFLQKSLLLRQSFGQTTSIGATYNALSESNKDRGNFQKAYEYFVNFKAYEDSVLNETKALQIAELQTEYETEKKDQAIETLKQESEIQQMEALKWIFQIYLSLAGIALLLFIAFVFYYRSRLKQTLN